MLCVVHGPFDATVIQGDDGIHRRSLFEKDKLLFAFLLAGRILGAQGQLDSDEWLFLLTGGLGESMPSWTVKCVLHCHAL